MDVYSSTLLAAMVATGGASLIALAPRRFVSTRVLRAGRVAVGLGILLLVTAIAVHIVAGHGPDSVAPMGVVAFLRAHPAVVGVILLMTMITWRLGPAAGVGRP